MDTVRVHLQDEDVGPATQLVEAANINYEIEPKAQVVDPVTIMAISAGTTLLAGALAQIIAKFRGGTVIDLRTRPPEIKRSSAVDPGVVVILVRNGSVKIERHSVPKDGLDRLLAAILASSSDDAKDVGSKALELLGPEHVQLSEGNSGAE